MQKQVHGNPSRDASRGYIVATLYHYRANTYDSTVMYLANKLWQRPLDVSLDITFLLKDKVWGPHIDPSRIGVAGHSQGGFAALWIGGAKVNPDKYLAFQRSWRNNQMVPEYLRKDLPLDARPALNVRDSRVKAVFAMAPGGSSGYPNLNNIRRTRLHQARESNCHYAARADQPDLVPGPERTDGRNHLLVARPNF